MAPRNVGIAVGNRKETRTGYNRRDVTARVYSRRWERIGASAKIVSLTDKYKGSQC
jgi:hypothetical protein